jgi:hypothetical protein
MGFASMGGNIKTNNMAEQTAVDWIFDTLVEQGYFKKLPIEQYHKAKAIENDQIEDAFHAGKINAFLHLETMSEIKDAAQYYNETYGQAD